MIEDRSSEVTYRGVIGRDIEQDFRSAPAAHISVAVPHTCYQVGLISDGKRTKAQIRSLNRVMSVSPIM